jgi:hypothetical protein
VYGSDVKNMSTGVLCSVVIKLESEKTEKHGQERVLKVVGFCFYESLLSAIRLLSSVVQFTRPLPVQDPGPAKRRFVFKYQASRGNMIQSRKQRYNRSPMSNGKPLLPRRKFNVLELLILPWPMQFRLYGAANRRQPNQVFSLIGISPPIG